MSTKTEVKVDVKASAKVTTEVRNVNEAESRTESATLALIRAIQTESKRLAYDQSQARLMLVLSIREASKGTDKLPKKPTDEQLKEFDNVQRFKVSRLMAYAFPKAEVAADVNAALAHDEKLNGSKHGRVGFRRLADIAQGRLSFADAKEGKTATKVNPSQATPKVLDLSATALENDLAGIRSKYAKATAEHAAAFTPKQLREMAAKVFCDGAYKPTKAEKTEEKAS